MSRAAAEKLCPAFGRGCTQTLPLLGLRRTYPAAGRQTGGGCEKMMPQARTTFTPLTSVERQPLLFAACGVRDNPGRSPPAERGPSFTARFLRRADGRRKNTLQKDRPVLAQVRTGLTPLHSRSWEPLLFAALRQLRSAPGSDRVLAFPRAP